MSSSVAAFGSRSLDEGCLARVRTWTLLIQSQTCCQLHHEAIIYLILIRDKFKLGGQKYKILAKPQSRNE